MGDLSRYAGKRDFGRTPEPPADEAAPRPVAQPVFVVQRHEATRLHWDLRLEHEGVLKSWAVTNEPSLDPSVKRLAVRTEDHPLAYADFEGTIPAGGYGAGEVVIWDRGSWTPRIEPRHGFEKGHLEFDLDGKRMAGRWHLVRLKGDRNRRPGSRAAMRENWLLIKGEDDAAAPARNGHSKPASSPAKRLARLRRDERMTSADLAEGPDEDVADTAGDVPAFVPPALAASVSRTPRGEGWLHEVKLDGYRIQAALNQGRVALRTRNGLDWTGRFDAIAQALAALPGRHLIDGEIVVEDAQGRSDFGALQAALSGARPAGQLVYWAFDLLIHTGADIRRLPLIERKARLAALLADAPPALRFSPHFDEDGAVLERHACRLGLEGIVSKRADEPYPVGRSGSWVKSKCKTQQEFLICGFTTQLGAPGRLGSLLIATGAGDDLRYAGRVGTGFDGESATALLALLRPRVRDKAPFSPVPANERGRAVTWVEPDIVAAIDFPAWTRTGLVRHGVYKGLREDKTGQDVPRDAPPVASQPAEHEGGAAGRWRWRDEGRRSRRTPPTAPSATTAAPDRPRSPRARLKALHRGGPNPGAAMTALTHPERVFWPALGVTKQQLAAYYEAVWPWIAPHIVDRPLALLRAPDGVGGASFFQKHAWSETQHLAHRLEDGTEVIAISELPQLLTLVQYSVLELHPWGAAIAAPEAADQLIFDLDPGEGVTWPLVQRAAAELRSTLDAEGLTAFAKLSGSKGIHVVVPLARSVSWDMAKATAKAIATRLAKAEPGRYVATMSKSARKGRIFIDYLRNGRGSTAIAPYSTRARPSGGIAKPVSWDELADTPAADAHAIGRFDPSRLARQADPWASFRSTRNRLHERG